MMLQDLIDGSHLQCLNYNSTGEEQCNTAIQQSRLLLTVFITVKEILGGKQKKVLV